MDNTPINSFSKFKRFKHNIGLYLSLSLVIDRDMGLYKLGKEVRWSGACA